MPVILLARHAQASFGASCYDVLSKNGHAQAAALAGELQRRGVRPARVVSGSLRRQIDTARPSASHADIEVECDRRWNEYDADDILTHHSATTARLERTPHGAAPAVSSRALQALLDAALLEWIRVADGGSATERWPAFAARVRAALQAVVAGLGPGDTALVCTSGGVVSATCVALLGLPAAAMPALNRVTVNAGVTKLVHGRGGTTLVSFNEHGHLEAGGRGLVTYR